MVGSIANVVASTSIFLSLSASNAANLALLQAYILSNDAQVLILQMKTQFQSYTLDLSENKNSTVFNSNIKVTDGPLTINNENEIVTLNVTKASTFKKGVDVTENIQNHGTLNQEGVSKFVSESTFADNVNLVDYVKNPNTNTQQTIIPILKIATSQTGNKIVLYNKNYDVNLNPYICGINKSRYIFNDSSIYGLLL